MNPYSSSSAAAILVALLIKLAVIALLAGFIARFGRFRQLIFIEQRSPSEKLEFAVFLGIPFTLGVLARLLAHYPTTDLSLEVTVVAGLLGGTIAGLVVGMMVSLPAVLIGHELWAAPLAVLYAVVAGTARWVCPDKEEVWKFSGFIDLSLYRSIKQRFQHPAVDWQVLFSFLCVMLEVARMTVGRMTHGKYLYYMDSPHLWVRILIVLATLIAVGLPVRIWNNTRIERKLVEQEKALLQARMDALISQINPHFLFNTLNTVSSLIRFDPDTARDVLFKLANILRRRLKSQIHFVPLKQELEFIDDYLDIEVVRFGQDKLQIRKEIETDTLDVMVPSMILQPLLENAIRHGIGPKIEGGTITLRATHSKGHLVIEVIDDGVGIPEERRPGILESGIGISNVHERLKVLYGQDSSMKIESQAGKGTVIRLEIPELVTTRQPVSVETAQVSP
ncbi:MAG: histidine kinase [Terriglobia bacterium]|jgi:two-component system LytT family sensor kinase